MTDSFWNRRRVLITGASGFIGAWLARTLIGLGAEVCGYDKSPGGALDLHPGLRDKLEIVLGDLTDQLGIEETLAERQIETVYHLAAQSSIALSKGSPVPAFVSNIQGTWCLLDACRAYGKLDTIALAASNTVYGDQQRAPFAEDFPLNGIHPYAASKVCTDVIARSFAATYGLPIAIARATNTYGTMDPHLDHIIPGTFFALLRGERPVIRSDGSPAKGYLYIADTVDAYRRLGERAADADVRGKAFNFHPERPSTVLELVQAIARIAGRQDLQPIIQGQPGKYEYEFLDTTRARTILGWEPRYSLEAGLAETYAWLKTQAGSALTQAHKAYE
jgi:CDP-glucose 4,6-dehydratase